MCVEVRRKFAEHRGLRRVPAFVVRALSSARVGSEAITLAVSVLVVFFGWCLMASRSNFELLAGIVPTKVDGAFGILWQAHTAIVGLSIPLLVLLVERGDHDELLATPRGQALISESWILVTTVLSLGSVVIIGVSATYVVSSGALLACLTLSCLCVVLITRGYVQALRLILSPIELRESSIRLLAKRTASSIEESFVVSAANTLLAFQLGSLHPARLTGAALRSRSDWVVIRSPKGGVVTDVHLAALKVGLHGLVEGTSVGPVHANAEEAEIRFFVSDRTALLLIPIGDRVRKDEPLLAYRGRPHASPNRLARTVRIDR